jgi:hypothetical protein
MRRETILVKIPIIIISQPPTRWLMLFIETSNTFSVSQPPMRWLINAGMSKQLNQISQPPMRWLIYKTLYTSGVLGFSATYAVVNLSLICATGNYYFLSHLCGG